jgi:hypothetical protein
LEDDGVFPIRRPSDEAGFAIVIEKDKERFLHGREGDHLLTTFQCDLCQYRNIKGHEPLENEVDEKLLVFIRRANMDALWSREAGTVKNTSRDVFTIEKKASQLGLDINTLLPRMGPLPLTDNQGMGLAVCMLLRSLDAGKNEKTIQFSTTQKMKSSYANVWRASVHGSVGAVVVRDTTKLFHSTCPTHGEWFERFTKGMHERMGDKVMQDLGMSIELMHELMRRFDTKWEDAGGDRMREKVVLFPALFSIVAFCCALRGEEVPLMRLFETQIHLEESVNHATMPHVIIALMGRMKNEVSENHHFMPIVIKTQTGLEPGKWIQRMVTWYDRGGIQRGWVFRNQRNEQEKARASDYEEAILSEIDNIQRETVGIVGAQVNVFDEYGVSRSFRRGSDAHALNQGVSIIDIEINNRWRSIDSAGGKAPRLRMVHHYSDLKQLLKSRLRYSKPL